MNNKQQFRILPDQSESSSLERGICLQLWTPVARGRVNTDTPWDLYFTPWIRTKQMSRKCEYTLGIEQHIYDSKGESLFAQRDVYIPLTIVFVVCFDMFLQGIN